MARFHRDEKGTPWFEITWRELALYSDNFHPICDECLKSLIGCDEVVLVPIFNEAFCPECGKARLARIHRYPEDLPVEERRTQFYSKYFGIQEEVKI
jgi:hypothetical protein